MKSTITTVKSYQKLYERNMLMKKLIDDVIIHIKAFDGDVYGGVVRDYSVGNVVYIQDINCRLDNSVLHLFMQTLYVYFDIEEITVELGGSFANYRKKIKVMMKDRESDNILYSTSSQLQRVPYVYVDIVTMCRIEWMRLPCDFDVNVLAENSHSLYIRVPYNSLNKHSDRLNFVRDRIKDTTFCSLEDSCLKIPEQVIGLIDRALRLVMRGWVMDDMLLGDKTWVLSQWNVLSNELKMVRKKYDKNKYDQMVCNAECAICNEEFKPTDTVINTRCNHNFHWNDMCATYLPNKSIRCKGLKEWVKRGKITCPVCRQFMF
jgi:RING-like zinc finger